MGKGKQSQTVRNEEKWAIAGLPCLYFRAGNCKQGDRCTCNHVMLSWADFEALKRRRADVVAARKAGRGRNAADTSTRERKDASRSIAPQITK